MFLRSIGSAIGVAVFGAIANAVLNASGGPDRAATAAASSAVFDSVVVAGLATLVAAIFMPQTRAEHAPARAAAEPA
jgi:hypothetical protein